MKINRDMKDHALEMPEDNTFFQWRRYGKAYLESCGIEEAMQDAKLLMEYVSGLERNAWFMRQHDEMPQAQRASYLHLLRQRGEHIPLQQLTGGAWFYGYYFRVNEHVLIPRQDTEILAEEALHRLTADMKLLDMCTGSGCILLTLMKESACSGVGSDLSEEALEVAAANAEALSLQPTLLKGDLFAPVEGRFDMIVSNPPYIRSSVIPTLTPEVKDHEPHMALDGHADGLYFYRRITHEAGGYLKTHGWLCFEIGYDQGQAVSALMKEAGFQEIQVIQDLAGLDRVVLGQWNK